MTRPYPRDPGQGANLFETKKANQERRYLESYELTLVERDQKGVQAAEEAMTQGKPQGHHT